MFGSMGRGLSLLASFHDSSSRLVGLELRSAAIFSLIDCLVLVYNTADCDIATHAIIV
jgi:hypothetical protein